MIFLHSTYNVVTISDIFRGVPFKLTLDITTSNVYFVGLRAKHTQTDNVLFVYIIGVISPHGDANIIYEGDKVAARGIVLHPQKG